MIIKTIQGDIFNSDAKHIAFAINTEGLNDSGFAGLVSKKYWEELKNCGKNDIGTVLSKKFGDKTFHALVCHSLLGNGWGNDQVQVIKKCFDKIPADGELIAAVAIGTGLIGQLCGANEKQIICGMHDSTQNIVLYGNCTLDMVEDYYKIELERQKEKTKMFTKKY